MPHRLTIAVQPQGATACKPCGHIRHVGTCSTCQRAQLARWSVQLAQAQPERRAAQH